MLRLYPRLFFLMWYSWSLPPVFSPIGLSMGWCVRASPAFFLSFLPVCQHSCVQLEDHSEYFQLLRHLFAFQKSEFPLHWHRFKCLSLGLGLHHMKYQWYIQFSWWRVILLGEHQWASELKLLSFEGFVHWCWQDSGTVPCRSNYFY